MKPSVSQMTMPTVFVGKQYDLLKSTFKGVCHSVHTKKENKSLLHSRSYMNIGSHVSTDVICACTPLTLM